ncbi:hypothetical protein ACI8AC_02435 [Geodermatophilus sp. SYSU D00758]
MRPVRLRIDHLAVEIGEDVRAGEAEATVRSALALLATRLAGAPLGGGRDAPRRALQLIELEPGWADRIAGPEAAARLADELFRRIAGAAP